MERKCPLSLVLFSCDVRGASSSKSKVTECVKGVCWFDELKAAFLKFLVVDKFTEVNCDCQKFGFPKCVGRGAGAIDDTHIS